MVTSLINLTGSKDIPALYLMLGGLIGLWPILRMRETARVPMEQAGKPSRGDLVTAAN